MKVLVTGAAGFIGLHTCLKLVNKNFKVLGVDNLNNYYDVNLKNQRLHLLQNYKNFNFIKSDIVNKNELYKIFENFNPDYVINLAAQAGVRYSISNPDAYISSNITGFMNILECCKKGNVKHLVYASSSSVYGGNKKLPFSEDDRVDNPISIYAATKKSNELMAHVYSHMFKIPSTGLRFFTVYGPWGRPDMALFLFVDSIIKNKPIKIFNDGNMVRSFTYIDDIVEGIIRVLLKPPIAISDANILKNNFENNTPYKILNIGNKNSESLLKYIEIIEDHINKKAIREFLPLQQGDVPETLADVSNLENWIDFNPKISIEVGIKNFVKWYFDYYNIR